MRKIYSLVLIAAGLLIGTNAWGFTAPVIVERSNASLASHALPRKLNVTNGHETQTADDQAVLVHKNSSLFFASIDDAINAIESNDTVTLKLLNDVSATAELVVKDGMFVTLDLNNHVLNIANYIDVGWNSSSNCRLDIVGPGNINMATGFFYLKGSTSPDAENFAVLNIGENVIVNNPDYYVLGVFNPSYGIVINVAGYVGGLYGSSINGTAQQTTGNPVQINILPTGTMAATGSSAGIYAAGYGIWNIQGTVIGDIGIYAKAGDFTLDGATIMGTGEYVTPEAQSSGYGGGGSALIFDSMKGYAGQMHLTVKGDTKVSSTDGYAIEEVVTEGTNHMTGDGMRIESGTFIGKDEEHCLFTTDELKTIITTNGSLTGGIFNGDIVDFVNNSNVVITYVDMGDGNQRWTIGLIPSDEEWVTDMNNIEDDGSSFVQLNNTTDDGNTDIDEDVEVRYLAMLGKDTITVKKGNTLTADEVVLNKEAVIIVEEGAKLAVTSSQGIISTKEDNLLIKAQDGLTGNLLINPEVTFNTTPKATVSFISKAYFVDATNYVYQRFGIPMGAALESFTSNTDKESIIYKMDYQHNKWIETGHINGTPALDPTQLNEPFGYYQIITNTPNPGTIFTMTGALVGNTSPSINLRTGGWVGFANSYVADMDIFAFLKAIPEVVHGTVYTYHNTGEDAYTWEAVNLATVGDVYSKIEPMQAFLIENEEGPAANMKLDYASIVWNPAINPTNAPARNINQENKTKVRINVANANGLTDNVTLVESDEFSEEYDNGYDAKKCINEDINFYVTKDQKMSVIASDNIDNTYIGFSCVNGGTYTINFRNLMGDELVLIDLVNNMHIAMNEDMTYEFEATANEVNDYRFAVVKASKTPTGTEQIKAKMLHGVYTIMGQYVGTMADWNRLAKGVYLVNGQKMLK